jgi:hypothetical protein
MRITACTSFSTTISKHPDSANSGRLWHLAESMFRRMSALHQQRSSRS